MQTNPLSNPSPTRPSNLIQLPSPDSSPQLPSEMSPEEASKQRWKILFFLCSSTFGASFISYSLSRAVNEKRQIFDLYGRRDQEDLEAMMGYLYLIPIIAGLMIYRFGIIKAFRCLVVPVILGSLLTVYSFRRGSYISYLWGEFLVRGPALGLWVAQICMITKWFKGKELSLAIGLLYFSRSINYYIVLLFNSYIETIGLLSILSFGAILCVLAGVAVIFTSKVDSATRQEGALVEEEETKLNKPVTTALVITIICFKLAEKQRWSYWTFLINSHSQIFFKIFSKVEPFSIFAPMILFPLFGFLADKKGGRMTGAFSSLLLLFIGNVLFLKVIESVASADLILAPSLLFQIGSHLFEVSMWGILGSLTPKRFLGGILGIAYSLTYFGPQFLTLFMPAPEKGLAFALGAVLMIGIVSMFYAWIGLKRKEDFSQGANNNEPQIIQAET